MIRTLFKGTYQEYLARQAEKSAKPKVRERFAAERAPRVQWFRERFAALPNSGSALCLGARYGEEVEALCSLNWQAKGIDLSACSPWVERGDMNDPPAGLFDLIYTNAFDHCWEPEQLARRMLARLNPGGICVLHIASGPPGAFETVAWDSIEDVAALFPNATTESLPEFYGLDTEIVVRV